MAHSTRYFVVLCVCVCLCCARSPNWATDGRFVVFDLLRDAISRHFSAWLLDTNDLVCGRQLQHYTYCHRWRSVSSTVMTNCNVATEMSISIFMRILCVFLMSVVSVQPAIISTWWCAPVVCLYVHGSWCRWAMECVRRRLYVLMQCECDDGLANKLQRFWFQFVIQRTVYVGRRINGLFIGSHGTYEIIRMTTWFEMSVPICCVRRRSE